MHIPIFINHNRRKIIGIVTPVNDALLVDFGDNSIVTREMFFNIFKCGAHIVKQKKYFGKLIIVTAKIIEFSL